MRMDVAARKAAARCNVKVSNHLVHPDDPVKTTSFPALDINLLGVALPVALFDILALPKRPLPLCVGLPYFVTGVAATLLPCIRRRRSSTAFAAVVGIEMYRVIILRMPANAILSAWLLCR
jgi:hypothetical protein